ncbi:uncharacterized protein K489DRAFT_73631 [Dissoconium aciculare CBS 342.82]|uniref:Uncharacterized protein n=1 Tax=Dissoconium aciculare CBS 342.82 TaxID=1314786 RepID=A0A6J3LWS1_9PEZI|nr:uncharacterized protein K489DRAFT_73631 [Dissoconium aciculare CBS 342.82]KAF1819087.1 hypothetical protein K489DRAFT_73631 [Dissoconium aciculare CBS 342.82]
MSSSLSCQSTLPTPDRPSSPSSMSTARHIPKLERADNDVLFLFSNQLLCFRFAYSYTSEPSLVSVQHLGFSIPFVIGPFREISQHVRRGEYRSR